MRPHRFASAVRVVAALTLVSVASCASTTVIQSLPPGAKVYLNGEPVGRTPYAMTDTKIVGSTTTVRLEYPGYEPVTGSISRNEEFDAGACLGGVFLLFPFLWVMGYRPLHTFELHPAGYAPWPGAGPGGYPPAPAPAPYDPDRPGQPLYAPPPGAVPPPAPGAAPPPPAPAPAPAPKAPAHP